MCANFVVKKTINNSNIKQIELKKFYFIHDGTRSGHPGFILEKDEQNNRYLVARFDSDKFGDIPKTKKGVRHITKLSKTTSNLVMNSYVHNRPMLCKRKDIGKEMFGLKLSQDDQNLIDSLLNKDPELSPSLRKTKTKKSL